MWRRWGGEGRAEGWDLTGGAHQPGVRDDLEILGGQPALTFGGCVILRRGLTLVSVSFTANGSRGRRRM
jgi:hypothetical protein